MPEELFPKVEGYDSWRDAVATVENAEIVVGIPSRNVVHTIAYVLKQAAIGLEKYYGGRKTAIVVCDGLSDDGTVDVVNVMKKNIKIPLTIIPNLRAPGKGAAMRTIIELIAMKSDADILVFIDSDLRSITPEWIPLLAHGAIECGFTAPLYRRHRFDATITNFMARPLTAMAYGIDIKQPIGGDFGLNRGLVDVLANNILWTSNPWTHLFGVDIFLTHTALASGVNACEALLKAKIHEAKDPSKGLKNMFVEVTGSLFTMLIEYRDTWTKKRFTELESPPVIDEPEVPDLTPWEVRIDPENTRKVFHHGLHEYRVVYEKILDRNVFEKIYSSQVYNEGIDRELWSTIVLEFFKYFVREPAMSKRAIVIETLFPLWQGRLYRYYSEVEKLSDKEVEEFLKNETKAFVSKRKYFLEEFLPI